MRQRLAGGCVGMGGDGQRRALLAHRALCIEGAHRDVDAVIDVGARAVAVGPRRQEGLELADGGRAARCAGLDGVGVACPVGHPCHREQRVAREISVDRVAGMASSVVEGDHHAGEQVVAVGVEQLETGEQRHVRETIGLLAEEDILEDDRWRGVGGLDGDPALDRARDRVLAGAVVVDVADIDPQGARGLQRIGVEAVEAHRLEHAGVGLRARSSLEGEAQLAQATIGNGGEGEPRRDAAVGGQLDQQTIKRTEGIGRAGRRIRDPYGRPADEGAVDVGDRDRARAEQGQWHALARIGRLGEVQLGWAARRQDRRIVGRRDRDEAQQAGLVHIVAESEMQAAHTF